MFSIRSKADINIVELDLSGWQWSWNFQTFFSIYNYHINHESTPSMNWNLHTPHGRVQQLLYSSFIRHMDSKWNSHLFWPVIFYFKLRQVGAPNIPSQYKEFPAWYRFFPLNIQYNYSSTQHSPLPSPTF